MEAVTIHTRYQGPDIHANGKSRCQGSKEGWELYPYPGRSTRYQAPLVPRSLLM